MGFWHEPAASAFRVMIDGEAPVELETDSLRGRNRRGV